MEGGERGEGGGDEGLTRDEREGGEREGGGDEGLTRDEEEGG
jgi:hypothetical protein